MSRLRQYWPLVVAIAVLWVVVGGLLKVSAGQNQGHVIYALDDAYIHMAMAKNLVQHGVWGVNATEFSSSSSSPLWTLMVAGIYLITGPNEITPLLLNILLATLVLVAVHWILSSYTVRFRSWLELATLLAVIYFTSLPGLIFVGLEHTLQVLADLAFIFLAAKAIAEREVLRYRTPLLLLAAALPMVRYEGLFIIGTFAGLFALRREWKTAVMVLMAGVVPVAVLGFISLAKGWFFLPNGVLLKGNLPAVSSWEGLKELLTYSRGISQFMEADHLLKLTSAVVLSSLILLTQLRRVWTVGHLMAIGFMVTTVLHMEMAGIYWFYRYEAYLLALGLVSIAAMLLEYLQSGEERGSRPWLRCGAVLVLVGVAAVPLYARGKHILDILPQATTNIYEQQYQMATFFQRYYAGQAVAANDIGAICYLSGVYCVDLWGLGTLDVATAKVNQCYCPRQVDLVTQRHQVKAAIIYDEWLNHSGGVPRSWVRVGAWTVPRNVVVAYGTVDIYAVVPEEESNLIAHLRDFACSLPAEVAQAGKYTRD